MDVQLFLVYIACLVGLVLICKLFIVPIKMIIKLIVNSLLGAVLIYIINLIGITWNMHIGINFITAIIVGILGIPRCYIISNIKFIKNNTTKLNFCSVYFLFYVIF